MTQNEAILSHLKKGRTLTPLQALAKFNCWALSSRISNLKAQGHPVKSELVKRNGKVFSQYSL